MQRTFREAALLLAISCAAGFTYTAATKQALFSDRAGKPTILPQLIKVEEAKQIFDSRGGLFLDSRHEFDFKLGHIAAAVNIPVDKFEQQRDKLTSFDSTHLIVVYCDGAECNSSFEMAGKLYAAGYTNVRIFFSGWQDWQQKQYPIEK